MTKEEIIKEVWDERNDCFCFWEEEGLDFFDGKCTTVFKAMSEYAKQEIISFIEWLYADESRFENSSESTQLYNHYQQSLNNK